MTFRSISKTTLAALAVAVAIAGCGKADGGPSAPATGADDAAKTNVAIVLLDKPFITEFAGPLDVYHHVPADKMNVFVVSDTDKEQTTYEGLPFHANYTIKNAPRVDVLVVPSGGGSLTDDPKNGPVIDWIKEKAATAKYVTSHCEGAFLLGAAGLLDGKKATTFHTDTTDLQSRTPSCTVVNGERIVVDGNLITSAGGLASYEAALYVVDKLYGKSEADRIATALVFGDSNVKEAMASR